MDSRSSKEVRHFTYICLCLYDYSVNWKLMNVSMRFMRFCFILIETFANGSNFHQCIEDKLVGKPVSDLEIRDANMGHWESIQPVFSDICADDELLVEQTVVHPYLGYRGKFDCVTRYR